MRAPLEISVGGIECWDLIAAQIGAWTRAEGIALRDAFVLLPFAQLLPSARQAFARAGTWVPRIETTQTLAASLGPAPAAQAGQISFDATTDALSAAALLRSQAWGAAWAKRDPRGFQQAVASVVETAHALARAAFALPPPDRIAHWARARDSLLPMAGPGATDRLLARVALEWACLAPAPATDRLFGMTSPAAWIAVQAGGPDALTSALMAAANVPCLAIDTDAPQQSPFASIRADCMLASATCDGFEHEAQCAAAQVLLHVQRGEWPVALIAQDRVLVRRVRALLARAPLRVLDETGWKLSTTRAAAQLMALLQAARDDATTDALLDWLKTGTRWTRAADEASLSSLEAACRRASVARVSALPGIELDPAARLLAASATGVLRALGASRRQSLAAWLHALSEALTDCGAMASLQADDAGQQALVALRLSTSASARGAWARVASESVMGFDEFRQWVDDSFERAAFRPTAAFDDAAHVVITPMARAMLRPFAAIVFPGADDKRLGAAPAGHALLSDAQSAALGLPSAADLRHAELMAFVCLLAVPRVTFMRRRVDGDDPLGESPLVERLSMALAARGRAMQPWCDPRIERTLVATPIHMSAPSAPGLLPQRLSASACEALRTCPYRFFALNMLRLREDDELEREIEKRDYGTWLHHVLLDFHQGRDAPAATDVELARLHAIATAWQATQGLVDADFLPFAASFANFAPRYIAWLHARDARGARWSSGEDDISLQPESLGGTELRGIVDRIDHVRTAAGDAVELIDYKTGSAAALRDKVREPLEDTQLAFYAALMRTRTDLPLQAIYLALDGSKGLEEIEHPMVERSAALLVEGLAQDLGRLRAGAGLPALGEGSTCDYCAARGICRRDHWAEPASAEDSQRHPA